MTKKQPQKSFETLSEQLIKRCQNTKVAIEKENDPEDGEPYLILSFPCGRETRKILCFTTEKIEQILSIPFERYIFLNDYTAICSFEDGTIEAAIDSVASRVGGPIFIYRRLLGKRIDIEEIDLEKLIIDFKKHDDEELQISIGPLSESLNALTPPRLRQYHPSLKIRGAQISQHNQALNLLEKISDSIFFQLDQSIGLPLGIIRERRGGRLGVLGKAQIFDPDNFRFPSNEYDKTPISLYWYARSATGMPLLQFLAYYQVIEFYFPTYSQAEAKRKIKNILKDPTFRPDRDVDLGRILSTISGRSSHGYGDERTQLKATLHACLDNEALREFICTEEKRKEFLSSKLKGLTDIKIPINNPTADILNDVAERIYEIRCKIVHTKSGGSEEEVDLLLPFSKETEQLYFDIDLIKYVAGQILIAASSPLKI